MSDARVASDLVRKRAKDKAALNKLVNDLRTIVLTTKPPQPQVQTHTQTDSRASSDDEDAPSKTRRKIIDRAVPIVKDGVHATGAPGPGAAAVADASKADPAAVGTMSKTNSSQGSESVQTGKKKPKKKKRSVLANQSNPHHVDNCKPSKHH